MGRTLDSNSSRNQRMGLASTTNYTPKPPGSGIDLLSLLEKTVKRVIKPFISLSFYTSCLLSKTNNQTQNMFNHDCNFALISYKIMKVLPVTLLMIARITNIISTAIAAQS